MITSEQIKCALAQVLLFNLKPYSVWRHVRTNSLYMVIGNAVCSTNDEREKKEESVVYISLDRQTMHYRKVEEFMDGRFEFMVPQKERL